MGVDLSDAIEKCGGNPVDGNGSEEVYSAFAIDMLEMLWSYH